MECSPGWSAAQPGEEETDSPFSPCFFPPAPYTTNVHLPLLGPLPSTGVRGGCSFSGEGPPTMAEQQIDKELKLALSQIEKTFGKGAIMQLGEDATAEVQGIPTG